jgi:ABC-type branched-subunit amino acid transport system substrate-binding protein
MSRRGALAVPVAAGLALVLAACGGGTNGNATVAEQAPAAVTVETNAVPVAHGTSTDAAPAAAAPAAAAHAAAAAASGPAVAPVKAARAAKAAKAAPAIPLATSAKAAKAADTVAGNAGTVVHPLDNASQAAANEQLAAQKNGATDTGVTKTSIKTGTINMHGMALGNVLINPISRGMVGAFSAINDRGGVLGRRLEYVDCDDGPGEVSRAKACIKKMAGVDKIFAMVGGASWATASIHDDLKQYGLPYIGAWAYSQTEWQDPFMFPTHMSMIHEAMAGAHWAANVVKPKTYGLICLTSPEMQLACNAVAKIMDSTGAKMVKRADVSISETSMAAYVLSFRAANPEHIIHYVINPATMAKFMVEAAQQGYYPPKGVSGNHLAGEVVGSLLGNWPAGRYWTNTTYKLWGAEFMATMVKYARGNRGLNHHIVQAGYVGANIFALAAKAIGPNLTRARMLAQLSNGDVYASDASMDQKFSWARSERYGDNWNKDYGQGREFIYKYNNSNTVGNPDGSPNGFAPDPDQFVIHTNS